MARSCAACAAASAEHGVSCSARVAACEAESRRSLIQCTLGKGGRCGLNLWAFTARKC